MKKILKGIVATIATLIILAVIAFIVLINLTPRQLKLQNFDLGGYTVEELGLADTKLITIYKNFNALGKTKEDDVVTNGFDETDGQNASDAFDNSSLEGNGDYSSLLTTPVTYDKQYLVEYGDTTLGYILNNIVQNSSSNNEAIKYLHDANIKIKELTIDVKEGVGYVRIVAYVEIASFKAEIEQELGDAKNFVQVPDKVYIVSEQSFTVSESTGKMDTTPLALTVNGKKDDTVGNAVMKIAFDKSGGATNEEELNANLGKAVADVIYNLGMIGSASVNSVGEVNGEIMFGMSGVHGHKLDIITHQD